MRKEKAPPIKARMLEPDGSVNRQWLRWFQDVGRFFDDYRRTPDLIYSSDTTLTTDDYGKTIIFDTSSANITCTLMTANSRDVYGWLTIYRSGENRLTILPDTSSRIEYGSFGGRVWNDESKRYGANLTLQLMTSTQWAIIGATGIWKYR